MNNSSDLQNKAALIQQSLEELHNLLSALEEKIKLGLFSAQLEIDPVEIVMPDDLHPTSTLEVK